jgi:hypothetical protein
MDKFVVRSSRNSVQAKQSKSSMPVMSVGEENTSGCSPATSSLAQVMLDCIGISLGDLTFALALNIFYNNIY